MQIKDLTRSQLEELRKEIVLNSLFLRDYENSFDIDPEECITFFDGYVETLYMYAGKNTDLDFFEICRRWDNRHNLYGYWCEIYA